jgi:hypothetical protein
MRALPVTTTDIAARIITRIDDGPGDQVSSPGSTSAAEVLDAINEGEQLFCLLTLCLESTVTLAIPAATPFSSFRFLLPDFVAPLRLVVKGTRIRPATLANLDAENPAWQATPGTPSQYVMLGFDLLALTPQPAFSINSSFTYARSAKVLADGDTPEIPDQYHPLLVDFGIYWIKKKEGGLGLQRGLDAFTRFLDGAQEHRDFVLAKSRAAGYDTLPFELALFDRSLLTS